MTVIHGSCRCRAGRNDRNHPSVFYFASGDLFLLTLDESLLHRVIERRHKRSGEPSSPTGDQEVAPSNAPEWLGENLCLQVDHQLLAILDNLLAAQSDAQMQRIAWANLPILNEWRGRFPDRDPVEFHQSLWKQRLISPGGGTYQWNATWQTMESTLYGHPLQPKKGPRIPEELSRFRFANLGITFDEHGLRAAARLDK